MKWLQSLLGMCEHRWRHVETYRMVDYSSGQSRVRQVTWVLKCEHCGNVKTKRIAKIS